METGVLVTVGLALVCRAFGGRALGLRGVEAWVIGTMWGVFALALGWFALGASGQLRPAWTWGVPVVLALLGGSAWGETAREAGAGARRALSALRNRPWRRLEVWAWALCAFLLAAALVQTLSPETGMDVGAYHFPLAKSYAQDGGFSVRLDLRSNTAGAWHVLYAGLFVLGGEAAAHATAWAFGLLALAGLTATAIRLGTPRCGAGAAVLLLTTPLVAGYSSTAYLEMPTLGALAAAALAIATGGSAARWMAAVACASLAAGAKLTAAYAIVPAAWAWVSGTRAHGSRFAVTAALIGLLAATPWAVWHAAASGELPTSVGSLMERPAAPGEGGTVAGFVGAALANTLATGPSWTESSGGLIWVMLFAAAVFRGGSRPLTALTGACVGAFLLIEACVDWRNLAALANARYIAPGLLAFGVPVAAAGWRSAWREGRAVRTTVWVLLALLAGPVVLLRAGKAAAALPAAIGLQSRDEFLATRVESYEASRWLDENAVPGSRVVAAVHRPYYLDVRYVKVGPERLPDGLAEVLERHRPDYLIYEPLRSVAEDALETTTPGVRLRVLFRARRVTVYEVLPP